MGQDRSQQPRLDTVLRDCGLAPGANVGLVGWKYLQSAEWDDAEPTFFVPAFIVSVLRRIVGPSGRIHDATPILMDPQHGLRAVVDADEIAMLEWGAARASAAVWRIVRGLTPGETEYEAAARMQYAGEPLSCHVMMTSSDRSGPVVGLASPTARRLAVGDGATTAVGYWGGLSARGGLIVKHDDDFLAKASGYFDGLCAWYAAADVDAKGADIHAAVEDTLRRCGLRPALNPGHLVSIDEWVNTPVRRESRDRLASGMPLQVDIIPVPMRNGETLNCEDAVVIADDRLRADLQRAHPAVYDRIIARRAFMRDVLGVELKASILPLSSTPLCLPPFWLESDGLLVHT
jgi:hypothetical protein